MEKYTEQEVMNATNAGGIVGFALGLIVGVGTAVIAFNYRRQEDLAYAKNEAELAYDRATLVLENYKSQMIPRITEFADEFGLDMNDFKYQGRDIQNMDDDFDSMRNTMDMVINEARKTKSMKTVQHATRSLCEMAAFITSVDMSINNFINEFMKG